MLESEDKIIRKGNAKHLDKLMGRKDFFLLDPKEKQEIITTDNKKILKT